MLFIDLEEGRNWDCHFVRTPYHVRFPNVSFILHTFSFLVKLDSLLNRVRDLYERIVFSAERKSLFHHFDMISLHWFSRSELTVLDQ